MRRADSTLFLHCAFCRSAKRRFGPSRFRRGSRLRRGDGAAPPHTDAESREVVERLRAQGKTVCMVGDGINDTPALAVADCAVAMGGGSDIAIESAGILLPSGNLEKLPELFDISRATIRTIRQNLTWALFYNLVSIPVAALGVLHPSICATAMSASSIGVLMHSLRLKDSDKKERRFPWKKKS